jgi:hypothetical protein
MRNLRKVLITISSIITNDTYYARSYPEDDIDGNGLIELYKTPVYKVFLEVLKNPRRKTGEKPIEWKALRYMPYWNDPRSPYKKYKARGWVTAGLSRTAKKGSVKIGTKRLNRIPVKGVKRITAKVVEKYFPDYGVQNRYSPFSGAIQIKGRYLIHAGPQTLSESGWGAAGCVEIFGNFDKFKDDIRILSRSRRRSSHRAIKDLVRAKKLFVRVEYAPRPNIRGYFYKEVVPFDTEKELEEIPLTSILPSI